MAVDLLHRIRLAARARAGVVLDPRHVQVLLTDPVYAALTTLERDGLLNSAHESGQVCHQSRSARSTAKPNLAADAVVMFHSESEQSSVEELMSEWL